MVGVGVQAAVAGEGKDYVGLEAADFFYEAAGSVGDVDVFELGVLIVEELGVGDAEDFAGGEEFCPAHLAEGLGGGCVAAVAGGLAVGEADDVGFDAAVGGEG